MYSGYVTADDGGKSLIYRGKTSIGVHVGLISFPGLSELLYTHRVTSSVADTIAQWHNAGGMVQYYDFPLGEYVDVWYYRTCV